MSLPAPIPLVFCCNPVDGDLPFKSWPGLSLTIDGNPEHDEKLLNLAGFLVRQALVDQHPQRIEHAHDVEALLYGLKAHVQLYSGGCFDFADEQTSIDLQEHETTPGMAIGNLLLLADEPGCEGIEQLHERLKPENALANALIKLQQTDMEPTHLICALLPAMSITLTPSFADSYTLEFPSRLETYQQELKQDQLAGLAQQQCEILLGDQALDERQPAYPIAYDLLSVMLHLLRQRAFDNDEADLAARQQEWQRLRLVIGGEVRHNPQFMLDPETYMPAFKQTVRGLKLAGTQSVLLPDHADLQALEQIWDALANEEARQRWEAARKSRDVTDRSLMVSIEVPIRLEVIALDDHGEPQVLECHDGNTFFASESAQASAPPTPASLANAGDTPSACDAIPSAATAPAVEAKRPSGLRGLLILAAVVCATLIVIAARS